MLTELQHTQIPRNPLAAKVEFMELATAKNLEFPLFKATKRQWLDAFLHDGTLRIGTVMDFAREEDLGRAIGDINEGSRTLLYTGKHAVLPLAMHLSIVNSYVFCCSKKMTPTLIKEWNADACFAIHDERFFREIAAALSKVAWFGIVHEIYYGDWETDPRINDWIDAAWIDRDPIAGISYPDTDAIPRITWLKDADLAYQHEVRAIYEPFTSPVQRNQPHEPDPDGVFAERFRTDRLGLLAERGVRADLKPILLKVPRARDYVSEVAISDIIG